MEGDGEEILIPGMIRSGLGVSLDEVGIGLINIGSTAFEYIASLFSEERIKRYCAIVTDLDKQAIPKESSLYKADAEQKGSERKEKLQNLFDDNPWVAPFYAEHTLEVEFVNAGANYSYFQKCISKMFVQKKAIELHKDNLENEKKRNEEVLSLAKTEGKGWLAILVSNELDDAVNIPDYILQAVAFAGQETINAKILFKMVAYTILGKKKEELKSKIELAVTIEDKKDCIMEFMKDKDFETNVVYRFINILKKLKGD